MIGYHDMILWYFIMISWYNMIISGYHIMILYHAIISWNHITLLYHDIISWYHIMISYHDIISWYHIMWPRQSRGHNPWFLYRNYTTFRDFYILKNVIFSKTYFLVKLSKNHTTRTAVKFCIKPISECLKLIWNR